MQATYCETLLGRTVAMQGEVLLTGRSLHLPVHDPDSQLPIFFSLGLPGAPISVLCGVMSRAAFLAADGLPSACRVVIVRVPAEDPLESSNRYLDADPAMISADLAALGVPLSRGGLASLITDFLRTGLDQVTPADRARFAALLDPAQLSPPGPRPKYRHLRPL